jgi:hypothetical protein
MPNVLRGLHYFADKIVNSPNRDRREGVRLVAVGVVAGRMLRHHY